MTQRPSQRISSILAAASAVSVMACNPSGENGSASGESSQGIGSISITGSDEGGASGGTLEAGGSGDEGDGDGDVVFDIGADDGSGTAPEVGCQSVDFLFVIDNSVSMDDNQTALVGAFPGFIEAIQNTLEAGSDYHIMVTDTDAWGRCDTVNGFMGIDPESQTCDDYIENTPFEECDGVQGAGVVHPAGEYATNAPCGLVGGNRYIVPEEPDLSSAFACVAKVGVAGDSSERPMDSMIAALSPELNAAGACNDGFLRDDALLVIAFMSDDPNYEDAGMPAEWYQAVVDAKLGEASSVVVLGLTPAWDGCQDDNDSPKGSHWQEFVEMWADHGVHGNVCSTAEEYVAFFESAVSTIDQACDEFQPPG